MYNIGFVLSGGGARGFAHLGIVSALAEKGIHPDIISGVSAGAIVGAFLASGRTAQETYELVKTGNLFRYTKIQLPKTGLLSLDGLQKTIDNEIPYARIEDLPVPFFVGTSNLTEGQMEYRNSGPLSKTVLASSSIPVLFSPVELDGCFFADGGLLDNIPVKPLIGQCRKIVVCNISPLQKPAQISNLVQMITRTFLVSIHARITEARKYADLYIEPAALTEFDVLSLSEADKIFEVGYKAVMELDDSVFASLFL